MSPLSEVRLVVQRELGKSFRSLKGIILLLLSLIGGTAVTLVLAWLERMEREELRGAPPETLDVLREQLLTRQFGDPLIGKALVQVPEVLLGVFLITVWLTPMLIAVLGFDAISGEVQHRSVRYWTLRSRRASYVIAKWLGLWLTISGITLIMSALVWIICIVRGQAAAGTTIAWGVRLWLLTLPISAAWCAIANLVSSLFKTPILALLATFAVFFLLWVGFVSGRAFDIGPLTYVYPNSFDKFLLHPKIDKSLLGVAACLGMSAVYVAASTLIFSTRDV